MLAAKGLKLDAPQFLIPSQLINQSTSSASPHLCGYFISRKENKAQC